MKLGEIMIYVFKSNLIRSRKIYNNTGFMGTCMCYLFFSEPSKCLQFHYTVGICRLYLNALAGFQLGLQYISNN